MSISLNLTLRVNIKSKPRQTLQIVSEKLSRLFIMQRKVDEFTRERRKRISFSKGILLSAKREIYSISINTFM